MHAAIALAVCIPLITLSVSCGGGVTNVLPALTASPSVSLSPVSLSFGSQALGTLSSTHSVTLTNTGNGALAISSITVNGDFAPTDNCGTSVGVGKTCIIGVTFTPTGNGTRNGTLTISDNTAGSPQTVRLSGTGGSSNTTADLSLSSLTFGNEPIAMVSSSHVVTLSNISSASLSVSILAFTGPNAADFTEVDTCGSAVAAGGNCTIVISFTPSAAGARTASLSVTDNASGNPQPVSLSGTGIHDVILSWAASPTPGVTGYYVYRGTTSRRESSTPINGTTYTDENVTAGVTYYYVVAAVAANGVTQSPDSNEATATVPSS